MASVKELEINNTVYDIKGKTVVDNNSGELSFWSGTKAQYDAIQNKNSKCLYSINDDTDLTLTLLETLYPVGSIYITTASTCPLITLISGSTWELVSSGRVLQGADSGHSAGTTIEAGLPNITGTFSMINHNPDNHVYSGAFKKASYGSSSVIGLQPGSAWAEGWGRVEERFDASLSNSIYGNSSTVQPPAYVVNIYRRTA